MTLSRFKVVHAGPYVTFQDAGRPGNMRFGVSASGPMDHLSFATANLAIGNDPGATAIEVSMGGMEVECLVGAVTMAVVGGTFQIECGEEQLSSPHVFTIEAGQRLSIRPGKLGSWCYLAIAGCFDVPLWLGKTATHSMSGFGGGMLKSGQEIEITESRVSPERHGRVRSYDQRNFGKHVRVVLGPQDQHFSGEAQRLFAGEEFTLTDAYDRMGVRLSGPSLTINGALSIPSEPVLKGSIQVAGDGVPTVLLADHQTTGGYPKIATIVSADLDDFAQLRPRQKIRFHAIDPKNAIALARIRAIELKSYFSLVANAGGSA